MAQSCVSILKSSFRHNWKSYSVISMAWEEKTSSFNMFVDKDWKV